jgi:hypothetical protein
MGTRVHTYQRFTWVPAAVMLLCAALAAAGFRASPAADAASSDTVTVTATAAAAMSISNGCLGSISWTLSIPGYTGSPSSCTIDYGATNDTTQKIQLEDNDTTAPFLVSGANSFGDTASDCAALTGDTAGVKISAAPVNNSAIAAGWGGATCSTITNSTTNDDYRKIPASWVDACQSSTSIETTHRCQFSFGVNESGGNQPPGTYQGIATFQVIDY